MKKSFDFLKFYKAKINYQKEDDLHPLRIPNGSTIHVHPLWEIDRGDYIGQFAFMPAEGYHWIPECDLEILEEIDYDQYKEANNLFTLIRGN